MRDPWPQTVLSRRGWLNLLAGAGATAWNRVYARPTDFWNKKPPAEWSNDEIDRLITSSPWAKQVSAEGGAYERGGSRGGGTPGTSPRGGGVGGPNIGIGDIGLPRGGIGGIGGPGMGAGRGGGGRSTGRSQVKGTVRWESAKPILEALKTSLAEEFAGHYVISVSGFPFPAGRDRGSERDSEEDSSRTSQDALDRLKSFTSLEPRGKRGAQPGVVQRQPGVGGGSILFGFSKEFLDLGPGDGEAVFSTTLGRLSIKTKFDLKAMLYHGTVAL
ncbi:MAG: hypothetical protein Q8N47_07795 [Bryobacterales bacterium]|nr:hypothetical protein [Bryobacterales bacterium]